MRERVSGLRRTDKEKQDVLRTKRAAPLTQSPALRGGGGELRLSDCVTKSHPWSLKYFMEPEVPGAEQLPLLQPGLRLQQGQGGTQPRTPPHPSHRHRQAGRPGKGLAGQAPPRTRGLQEQVAALLISPALCVSNPCLLPATSSTHPPSHSPSSGHEYGSKHKTQKPCLSPRRDPSPRGHSRPHSTAHYPQTLCPPSPSLLLSKPSPYPELSPPSPCSLLLCLHPSTGCSWDPSSHTAHQPPLQSLSNRGPSPYLQLSGPGGSGNLEEAT